MKQNSIIGTDINLYESVLMASARAKEIKEIRYSKYAETGHYVLGEYKKLLTPAQQSVVDIESGLAKRDYLFKSLNKVHKKNKGFNKHKR
jgi:hypothetical protein